MMDPKFGVVVFPARLDSAHLTARGTGGVTSAYTESGAEPGVPVPEDENSRWRPALVGAQTQGLTLATVRGGYAGRRPGATVAYRLETDDDPEDYRGWSPPNLVTGWSSPPSEWGAGSAFARFAAVTEPSTGILVVVAQHGTTRDAMTWSYDPRSDTWTDAYDWGANQGLNEQNTPTLLADPDVPGRVLLFSAGDAAYSSDDLGQTWQLYGRDYATAPLIFTVGARAGMDWLAYDGLRLLASSDRGATWDELEDVSADLGLNGTARIVPVDGGYLVAYLRDADAIPCCRRLRDARASFAAADEVEIGADDAESVHVTVDDDGTVYAYTRDVTLDDLVQVFASVDGGASWSRYKWAVMGWNSSTAYLIPEAVVSSTGSAYLLCSDSAGAEDVHLIRLGGWSTVESGGTGTTFRATSLERHGYGYYNGTLAGDWGGFYAPISLPPSGPTWAADLTGGTATTSSVGAPGLVINTGAATGRTYYRETGSNGVTHVGEAQLRIATDSGANPPAFVESELTNGATYSYRLQVRIDGGAVLALNGDDGTVLGTLIIDAATADIHVRWHLAGGDSGGPNQASVMVRPAGSTAWQEVCKDANVTNGTPVRASDAVTFGHRAVGTGTDISVWKFIGAADNASWLSGVDLANEQDLSPVDGLRGLAFGGPAPSPSTQPYPIPDATTADGGPLGRLGGSGPTHTGEIVSLPVAYRQGIEHVHPLESPSPTARWEASEDGETRLVYDLEAASWVGGALAIVAAHATLRTAVLERDNGAGGWVTVTTLDLSLGPIDYDRNGDTIVPATGTAIIGRYLHEGEIVGGWVPLAAGADVVYRRIAYNSAGYWTDASGVEQVRIRLEGVDGTEDATGTADLYHHSGVVVGYPSIDPARRHYRLTVEPIATDDGQGHIAGILAVGRVVGVGAEPGWTWTRRTDPTRTVSRALDGSPSVREDGAPREVWAYGWQEGLMWQDYRLAASPGVAVGATGGRPIGTKMDAVKLEALIEHLSRSGEIPLVVLPRLPADGVTVTDPTMWLYGAPMADASQVSGVMGTEGLDEGVRYDGITVEALAGRTPRF
jgi:hypothetical protein